MRKYVKTNLLLLFALILLMICSLTACGLITPVIVRVREAGIVQSGLEQITGNQFKAQIGKEFTLFAVWNEDANVKINPIWALTIDGVEADLGEQKTEQELKYTINTLEHTDYTFSLTINDVASENTIKVTPDYATLDNVTISSNKPIVQDVIQMSRFEYDTITLTVSWNNEFLNPSLPAATISWKRGDSEIGTTSSISLTPSDAWTEDENPIVVEVKHNNITKVKSVTIFLSYIYKCIDDISISMVSTTGIVEIGTTGQYYAEGGSPYPDITLSAVVTPSVGTNLTTPAKWELRTKDGPATATETGRTLTFKPTYGENIVTCTIDNLTSHTFTIFALPSADYTSRQSAIETTFVWNGNVENYYITDEYDMVAMVNNAIANRDYTTHNNVYYAQSEWRANMSSSSNKLKSVVMPKVVKMLDEAGAIAYTLSETSFGLTSSSKLGEPLYTTTATTTTQNTNIETHYKNFYGITTTRTSLPCYSFTKTMTVSNSNQLFRALSNFYKPTITDSQTQQVYDEAISVLRTICDDEMTEYQKVLAIYDWIITNVQYDTNLYLGNIDSGKESVDYDGYYLDGVFLHHKAVCDGKAKAFALLCGMEGIRCLRITGDASQPANPSDKSGHAWNKVFIDIDGNGVREWYIVDTTWGDRTVKYSETVTKENLSYTYFLLRDSDVSSTHTECDLILPQATTTFDYYQNTIVNSGALRITSNEGLGKVLEYYAAKVATAPDNTYSFEIEMAMTYTNIGDKIHDVMTNLIPKYYTDPNGRTYSQYTISTVRWVDGGNYYQITLAYK